MMNVNRPNLEFFVDDWKHDSVFRSASSSILMNKANALLKEKWGLYKFERVVQAVYVGDTLELDEFYQFRARPPQTIETAILYY